MTLEKALLRTENKQEIRCLFNPAEITLAKSNTWNAGESKGGNAPKLRFQGGQSERTRAAIAFRDVHAPHRLRMVASALKAVLKIEQPVGQALGVAAPCLPIEPAGRVLAQSLERFLEQRHL